MVDVIQPGERKTSVLTILDRVISQTNTGLSQAGGGGSVSSVNGKTGAVSLVPSDIGAATASQGALASTAVQPAGLTQAAVGLGNVNNTSDAAKPVSTATQTALNLLAPINSPAFTGTVSGITPAMVGAATSAQGALANTAVQQVSGFGLSSNDYTNAAVTKLAGIATAATANPNTDSLTEGSANKYWTLVRTLASALTGLVTTTATVATATDTILIAIGKLQGQISTLLLPIFATFTNTATSGTTSVSSVVVTVNPTANSTQTLYGRKIELDYSSSFNQSAGGYVSPLEVVLSTAGTGTHDKLVGVMNQLNATGGNITSSVGFEGVVSAVGASTIVSGHAAFYVANVAAVPNITNIQKYAAFQNDYPAAYILNLGQYFDYDSIEIARPYHTGLISGRYYSAPAGSITTVAMAANTAYVTYVYVPERTTITRLGFQVGTAGTGNAIMGLYKVNHGKLTTLIVQTPAISIASTGSKEQTVSAAVNAGVYALVLVSNGTPTIGAHAIVGNVIGGSSTSTGSTEAAYIPLTYGTLPDLTSSPTLPTFAANTIEPHLWFGL